MIILSAALWESPALYHGLGQTVKLLWLRRDNGSVLEIL